MTDQAIINKLQFIMEEHKHITRSELSKKSGVSTYMLGKLEKAGLVKLPLKLNYSQAATLGRFKRNDKFRKVA